MLLSGAQKTATENADMVQSRQDFLNAGHYEPIAAKLIELSREALGGKGGAIADAGAGVGWYLSRLLSALPHSFGVALDSSKAALKRAAKAHENMAAIGCDIWRALPLQSASIDLGVNLFAPRNGAELRRVLKPGGMLIVVIPNDDHLQTLVGALGLIGVDAQKRERLSDQLLPHFEAQSETRLDFEMRLGRDAITQLVGMGPSAWHHNPADLQAKIAALDEPCSVGGSVTFLVYKARA